MKLIPALTLALCALSVAANAQEDGPKFENFSVPGASTTAPPGTFENGTLIQDMNDAGEIVGYYTTAGSVPFRGFLREPNGKITLIDDPNAGTLGLGATSTTARTLPLAINNAGTIIGNWNNDFYYRRGSFIIPRHGSLAELNAPAGGYNQFVRSINASGVITGDVSFLSPTYSYLVYGFILDPNGKTTTFQAPDATVAGIFRGTISISINASGTTTGQYYDSIPTAHSYVRSAAGTVTEFAVPNAGTNPYQGAWPISIADDGTVLGFYADNNWVTHTYIRLPDGSFPQFNLPDPAKNIQVFVEWINHNGDMTGVYADAAGAYHTWVRLRRGKLFYITDPAAGTGTGQGTIPLRLNNKGEVAGYYIDAGNVYHGFLWKLDE